MGVVPLSFVHCAGAFKRLVYCLSCVVPEESITQYKKIPLLGHGKQNCIYV